MPLQDFKDFTRQTEWHANGITSALVTLPAQINTGFLDVSFYSSVLVYFKNSDANTYVRLDAIWTSVNLTTNDVPFQSIAVHPLGVGRWRIPVLEPLLTFQSVDLAGAGGSSFQINVVGTTQHVSDYESFGTEDVLFAAATSVAANSSLVVGPFNWYNGDVVVTTQGDTHTSGTVEFQYYSYIANAWKKFAAVPLGAVLTPYVANMTFPRAPVRAALNNNGALQNIELYVTTAP